MSDTKYQHVWFRISDIASTWSTPSFSKTQSNYGRNPRHNIYPRSNLRAADDTTFCFLNSIVHKPVCCNPLIGLPAEGKWRHLKGQRKGKPRFLLTIFSLKWSQKLDSQIAVWLNAHWYCILHWGCWSPMCLTRRHSSRFLYLRVKSVSLTHIK